MAPLAETLSIFFTAVAVDATVAGFRQLEEDSLGWKPWIACGVAIAAGIQLRPDGGLLLAAIGLYLLWQMVAGSHRRGHLFWAGALVLILALAPLVPWTVRNWRQFQ